MAKSWPLGRIAVFLMSSLGLANLLSCLPRTSALQEPAHGGRRFSLPAIRQDDNADLAVRATSGDETASIEVPSTWFLPVSIGTPPQSFLFLGDSGSVNAALGSTLLPESVTTGGPKYNPNASSTAHEVEGYTYKSCFGSGYCSNGVVFRDVFSVGNLTLPDFEFGAQTNHNMPSTGPRSGTLGLDFDKGGQTTKPNKVPSWLSSIMPMLENGVFTVDFNVTRGNGTFDFGYIDSSKYSGDIGYAPVNASATEWTIPISGQQLANGTYVPTNDWYVVVDTGTAGSRVPRDVADAYFSQVKSASYSGARQTYTFPCSESLPDFAFKLGEVVLTIPGTVVKKTNGTGSGAQTCTSIMHINQGDGASLWGRSFIEQFFVVFDWDNGRVGFANKGAGGNATASSSGSATSPASPSMSASASAQSSSSAASPCGKLSLGAVGAALILAAI